MLQLVTVFVNVIIPVFILVAIGYVASKKLQLDLRTLSRFSYFILTPAFVFGYMSSANVDLNLASRMIGFITTAYLGSAFIAFLVGRLLRRGERMTTAYVMLAVFGNVGNFGLPISQFAQGKEAVVPSAIYFLANLVLAFIVCVWAANSKQSKWRAMASVVKTPALIALVVAIFFNVIEINAPLFVTRPVELLSGGLIATMLVTLGAQLAASGIPKPTFDMLIAIAIRLISGPVLAFAFVGVFGLTGLERNVGIIQASMPTAVLVSLIAFEYDAMPEFIAPTVLLSNVLSIVSLTIVLALI